ncbi:MAG: SDR family oxidoreductase [Chloroflexi bacterium]|nr:SDR family oxidoreductase [Chloroflexota bacterium]
MTGPLQGRVAVITGGGRGIGAAIALEFAAAGAALALASRTPSELAQVVTRCEALGALCITQPTDVADPAAVRHLMEQAVARFQRLDILVNAAGVYGPIGLITDVETEAWVRALHVNLLGTLYACQQAVPVMMRQGFGRIINFSGGGATAPLPRFSAYGVSKAAVVRLTETLAEEVRPYSITVNAIAPGAVDTRLQDEVLQAGERAGDLYQRIQALRESGAGGTPPEVPAKLALFLASEASDGLTGRLISAPHDPWREWDAGKIHALEGTPWFTLRRIDPFTIGPLRDKTP